MEFPDDTRKNHDSLNNADPLEEVRPNQNNMSEDTSSTSEAGAALGGGILAASLGLGPVGALLGAFLGYGIAQGAKKK